MIVYLLLHAFFWFAFTVMNAERKSVHHSEGKPNKKILIR